MVESRARHPKQTLVLGVLATTTLFAAPFSRALFITAASLFALTWLFTPGAIQRIQQARVFEPAIPAVALFVLILAEGLLRHGLHWEAITNIRVYSKLLLVLMLAQFLLSDAWRTRATQAWVAGMAIVIVSTIANVFVDLPWSKSQNQGFGNDHSVFVEYVSQGIMTAIFSTYCLLRSIESWRDSRNACVAWAFAGLVSMASMLFLLQGRSGVIAFLVAIVTVIFVRSPRNTRVPLLALSLGLVGAIALSSPLMRERIAMAYSELIAYSPFAHTSIGLRIDMWKLAFDHWMGNFLLGTGSGSYAKIAETHFGHCDQTCIHPHNQFLFLAMEYGFLAPIIYLWFIFELIRAGLKIRGLHGSFLAAIGFVILVDGLYNSPLWYRAQSYFLYSLIGLALASAFSNGARRATDR